MMLDIVAVVAAGMAFGTVFNAIWFCTAEWRARGRE